MKAYSCYACGKAIPELRMNNGKYSFYCSKCTCATKEKGSIFAGNWWFIQRIESIGQVDKPMRSLQNNIAYENPVFGFS